jgi:hypothetical protein
VLTKGEKIRLTHQMVDGGGFSWDIKRYGTVGRGQAHVYRGGMYLKVGGKRFSGSSNGKLHPRKDEVQIGPWNQGGLAVHRRIRVYKDRPLARWLDVLHNRTGKAKEVEVELYSNLAYHGRHKGTYEQRDKNAAQRGWLITRTQSNPNQPSLLHVTAAPGCEPAPKISQSGSTLRRVYQITIPPRSRVVLCHFEAQGEADELIERARRFQSYRHLQDLTDEVRETILNFPPYFIARGIELQRSDTRDLAVLPDGKRLTGTIKPAPVTMDGAFGRAVVPAEAVVGLVRGDGPQPDRLLLVDGQILTGRAGEGKLTLQVAGGTVELDPNRARQWSYRVSPRRPGAIPVAGPMLELRSGDRLAFDLASADLRLVSRHGVFNLAHAGLAEVDLAPIGRRGHVARFHNQSRLTGLLTGEVLDVSLSLAGRRELPVHQVLRIVLPPGPEGSEKMTEALLVGGDRIRGWIEDDAVELVTEFGRLSLDPAAVREMTPWPAEPRGLIVELFNGTRMRGTLAAEWFSLQIIDGPTVGIRPAGLERLTRHLALRPRDLRAHLGKLVAQLGSVETEQAGRAREAIVNLGTLAVPVLTEMADLQANEDARQRIDGLIEELTASATPHATAPPARTPPPAQLRQQVDVIKAIVD